jgi:hypothetical protein
MARAESRIVQRRPRCYPFPGANKDLLLPDEKNPLIWINPGRISDHVEIEFEK